MSFVRQTPILVVKVPQTNYFSYFLTIVLLCAGTVNIFGQIPQNPIGLTPASLKWNQIDDEKVQIIFPRGLEAQARRVADIIHHQYDSNTSVGPINKKIPIILHNQTTTPNGLVTVGPFRSEFYLRSPQFNCTGEWLDMLTLHENQHVKQFANSQHGITKLAKTLLGSWSWGGLAATAMPRWFWEGNATLLETQKSASGRGRMPFFHMEYKALLAKNIRFNYEKAGARSFRQFVPNWYAMGYYMSVFGEKQYGDQFWQQVENDAVQYKGLLYPFSRSVKRLSGLSTKELYNKTMDDLQNHFQAETPATVRSTKGQQISKAPKVFTHYFQGAQIDNEHFIAIKSGFDHISQLVEINKGKERSLTYLGILPEAPFTAASLQKDLFCWSESTRDPRWLYKTYSVIKTYNLNTGKKQQITSKSRYFAPHLHPDGSQIVAVQQDVDYQYELHILNVQGALMNSIPNPDRLTYLHPFFDEHGEVYCIVQESENHYLGHINKTSGAITAITPKLPRQLSHPSVSQRKIVFAAAYQNTNNIYCYDLDKQSLFQLTDSEIGAFMPVLDSSGNNLTYSEYSIDGLLLKRQKMHWDKLHIYDPTAKRPQYYGQTLIDQEPSSLHLLPAKEHAIIPYKKSSKLFNIHSLLPTVSDPLYGAELLADNVLGTLRASAGLFYNRNANELTYQASVRYGGWYPEIGLTVLKRNRNSTQYQFTIPNDTTLQTNFYTESWNENLASVDISLPLRFRTGHYQHSMRMGIRGNYIVANVDGSVDNQNNNRDTIRIADGGNNMLRALVKRPFEDQDLFTTSATFSWRTLRNRSLRQLYPRLGLTIDASYHSTLDDQQDNQFNFLGQLFLPGIARNHHLWLQLGYRQESILNRYALGDRFNYPRGYQAIASDHFTRMAVNYAFPLLYPDISLGSIAFIKRVKTNLFYDTGSFEIGFPFNVDRSIQSVGMDLTFDIRFLRLVDVDVGFRYSRLLDSTYAPNGQVNQFEFLLLSISG